MYNQHLLTIFVFISIFSLWWENIHNIVSLKWTNVKVNRIDCLCVYNSLITVAVSLLFRCICISLLFFICIFISDLSFQSFSGRRDCLPTVVRNSPSRPVTTSAARKTGRPDGNVLIRRLQILHITSPPRSQMATVHKRFEASNITPALAKGRFLLEYIPRVFSLRLLWAFLFFFYKINVQNQC